MKEAISKKKFQEMLNAEDRDKRGSEHGRIVNGHKNYRYHQSKRLYGDYLRAQDPEMFNANYSEYLNGEHQDLNKYL